LYNAENHNKLQEDIKTVHIKGGIKMEKKNKNHEKTIENK
jgi:hypothetical protein